MSLNLIFSHSKPTVSSFLSKISLRAIDVLMNPLVDGVSSNSNFIQNKKAQYRRMGNNMISLFEIPYYHIPLSITNTPIGGVKTQVDSKLDPYYYDETSMTEPNLSDNILVNDDNDCDVLSNLSCWFISTLKRRKKKMNKHKLRKRRKLLRLKSKK